ncbi:mucin-1 isoform X2 [Xyrauchen texanus]|uniref:mucin-1 isoform X2 n=1 Tax=Xyrauchen texanus TaxID=154827 RepID=UPI002241FD3E|nr:mucin-1 isoform X2 [Xyrauchen texanus]
MRQTGLPFTGAAFCIMLFVASSAQPITILDILQAMQAAPQNYSMPTYSFFLSMEITNRVFNDSLLNPATKDYKQMYAEVAGALNIIYNCSTCGTNDSYRGVTDMQFREGSVIANCSISFKTIFINHFVVKNLFVLAIEKNPQPNGLKINKQFTGETFTPIWYFPKNDAQTTPMSRTTHSAIKDLGGATARTIPSGQNPAADTVTHNFYYYGIPGWAIALLVLACVILLLLIILLILLICCWCCGRKHKKQETTKLTEHAPYERTSFKEHLANPAYNPHSPQMDPNLPVAGEPQGLIGNHPGMYVLNSGR